MYCRRKGLPVIKEALRRTGILVILVAKYLLLERKRKHEPELVTEFLELRQDSALELKSLRLVVDNQGNLPGLIAKLISAKNRPSQTKRKAQAKRKERDQASQSNSRQ